MGPPEALPIRAVRTAEGGVLLAWNGLHLRHIIEQRMDETLQSLLAEPAETGYSGGYGLSGSTQHN